MPTTISGSNARATRNASARDSSPNSGQSTLKTSFVGGVGFFFFVGMARRGWRGHGRAAWGDHSQDPEGTSKRPPMVPRLLPFPGGNSLCLGMLPERLPEGYHVSVRPHHARASHVLVEPSPGRSLRK